MKRHWKKRLQIKRKARGPLKFHLKKKHARKPSSGSAPKTKEQKRREAQARNRVYAALKKQRKRVQELEVLIEKETARMDEILALLADPSFYTNEDMSSDVIAEHAETEKKRYLHTKRNGCFFRKRSRKKFASNKKKPRGREVQ